ncbi:glutathione S-transferase family protein [Sphingorhabdus pulchriflava]|uniref:Glutathione S-transferase family protein n=1 Tax=Sphingorhabdus pulchriflava TaxID=2292257 RepID=A0A371BI49_9SPHN|nr:glutathione S-transferase family protein [Sphingorhabdus pulchriflava]RDV07187.1 glutathione S-transferase family protein [Sphingorhabdus pulchriflava]
MILYGHPFSSYTWKALIPLYEKGLDFEFRILDDEHPEHWDQLRSHWVRGQMPVLVDQGQGVYESSIVIEHLDIAYPDTPRMIPDDRAAALRVRLLDRVFDCHLEASFQAAVSEYIPWITETPDVARVERARATLSTIYPWLEAQIPEDGWACGDEFSMADCSGAPALFYADWTQPIPDECRKLKAYRARLLARPSVARCVEGARPYRGYFPLGAPDRD